ncbi:MAG: pyridoxal phosphate-dependent decarboxylase family protein, partial [Acidobacteriota bacterium]
MKSPGRRAAGASARAAATGRFARRDTDAMGALLDGAIEMVRAWTAASAQGTNRVFPDTRGSDLLGLLREPLPVDGLSARVLLRELRRKILPFMRDNGSPRFFGYVMSPPSSPGVVADLIASALDQNVTAWRSAPGATEVERLVIDWLASIVGLPAGSGGILTSGGSMATFTALATARARHAPPATRRHGLGRLGRRMMTLYMSDEGHMSVPRAAQLLGRFAVDPAVHGALLFDSLSHCCHPERSMPYPSAAASNEI